METTFLKSCKSHSIGLPELPKKNSCRDEVPCVRRVSVTEILPKKTVDGIESGSIISNCNLKSTSQIYIRKIKKYKNGPKKNLIQFKLFICKTGTNFM